MSRRFEDHMNLPMSATADQSLVRKFNTATVLDLLRRRAPISRAEVAARTGLNRSTISSIINGLLEDGLVQETTLQSDRIGRPGMLLELNPASGFAVGVEVGVDFISVIVTDFVAHVLWHRRASSDPADGQLKILERAFAPTQAALDDGLARGLRPLGIGVGVPGPVDWHQGILRLAPNLGWKNTPLRLMWTQRFQVPVFVENDGNAAALGEYYFGVARGIDNVVYLNNASVGLGAGVLISGKLFRGSRGYATEIGHMILDPDGELCGCGRRGCLETKVGPRAVVRRVQEALAKGDRSSHLPVGGAAKEAITFAQVAEAARQGDAVALAALQDVGKYLGIGIANLMNIFNPQMVVLGGALIAAIDILLPIVERIVAHYALGLVYEDATITPSAHGTEACAMGAVALVLDDILRE
jgi:glucokinase-like ROK family protein